jgi:hypothetical protein
VVVWLQVVVDDALCSEWEKSEFSEGAGVRVSECSRVACAGYEQVVWLQVTVDDAQCEMSGESESECEGWGGVGVS